MFFDYCDGRIALFMKGEVASWSALFPESKARIRLFNYGDPWTRAPLKWGYERDRKTFLNCGSDRGDVQTWAPSRWIVTDSQGNIVTWCDAAYSSMPPPTHKTAWE